MKCCVAEQHRHNSWSKTQTQTSEAMQTGNHTSAVIRNTSSPTATNYLYTLFLLPLFAGSLASPLICPPFLPLSLFYSHPLYPVIPSPSALWGFFGEKNEPSRFLPRSAWLGYMSIGWCVSFPPFLSLNFPPSPPPPSAFWNSAWCTPEAKWVSLHCSLRERDRETEFTQIVRELKN